MKAYLSVLVMSALLLTGCAAESKYEYDEVDLMIYEKCIEHALGNSERIRPQFYIFQPYQLDAAKETCKDLLPNIKS